MGKYAFDPFRTLHAVLLCCVAIILPGCASLPSLFKVPVPVSCIKGETPAKPATTDEKALLAMDEYAATITTWAERLTLKGYAEKADAVIQACR